MHILKGIAAGLMGIVKGSRFNKQCYLNTLRMMYQFLNKVRKEGLLAVEMDVEKPAESAIFKNFPEFMADPKLHQQFMAQRLSTAAQPRRRPPRMHRRKRNQPHQRKLQPIQCPPSVVKSSEGKLVGMLPGKKK